ncbi:MAG: hypothetical protein OXP66_00045 [Candidatus Tectomicrobia bacterium]|nr:hypothetical protein [Candidatus Tectomicrobia bacterium]
MQSEDRVIDLLRAYVKNEAPSDIWQVVSADIANVLRKVVAVSAECQRAKQQLHELKKHVQHIEENFPLPTHMRLSTLAILQDPVENVEGKASGLSLLESEGVFLAPGRSARLAGVEDRPFLHWCKVCNEVVRSRNADPATCPSRNCRSALWRRGQPEGDLRRRPKSPAKT